MKRGLPSLLLIFILIPFLNYAQNAKQSTFYVAQWNVENLYDVIDDPDKDDSEFLPESEKFWTEGKLEQKLTNLTKVINYMNGGTGPDILAVEEVENFNTLKRLIYKCKDRDYLAAYRESPDVRGIDVGLIFDRNVFDIVGITPLRVNLPNGNPTRDILHVILNHKQSNGIIHFYVNHWPSRRGGKDKSDLNREVAAKILRSSIDSVLAKDRNADIIMLGDFNDGPFDESITGVLKAKDFECNSPEIADDLLNLTYKKAGNKEGSYLYYGAWDMIDQIIISQALKNGQGLEYECDSFEIIMPSFMIIQSGNRKGGALPTYMGSNHTSGYSDHFPVGAKFIVK